MADLASLPTPLLITVGLLSFVSVTLCLAGIAAVARTPLEHLPGSLPRPVWFAICVIQFVGPVVFFILRRRERALAQSEEAQTDVSAEHGAVRAAELVERLYG